MADLGIGVAGGALIALVHGINEYREEIKINKLQALHLASRAKDVTDHLSSMVTQAVADGLEESDLAYASIKHFMDDFQKMLTNVQDRMKAWSTLSWYERAWPGTKSAMQEEISKLTIGLMDCWMKFHDQLVLQSVTLASRMNHQGMKTYSLLQNAREEDAKIDAINMRHVVETLKLGQEHASQLEEVRNISISTAEMIQQLQKTALFTAPDDHDFSEAREELIEALRSYKGEYPPTGIDPSDLTMPFARAHYTGVHSVIRKGCRDGRLVAIKQLRLLYPDDIDVVFRRIRHEAKIWSQLRHPNIVSFLGCCKPKDGLVFMVSTWVEHEDTLRYLRRHRDADRLQLALDISHGLKYLHDYKPHPIIHASLQATHVLVNSDGVAQLNDFGISFISNECYTGSRAPAVEWSSLEQLNADKLTTASDIYSFATTFIEMLTLAKPYNEYGIRDGRRLSKHILNGLRPRFPGEMYANRGLPSSDCPLWEMLTKCWDGNPAERPKIDEVIEVLKKAKQ